MSALSARHGSDRLTVQDDRREFPRPVPVRKIKTCRPGRRRAGQTGESRLAASGTSKPQRTGRSSRRASRCGRPGFSTFPAAAKPDPVFGHDDQPSATAATASHIRCINDASRATRLENRRRHYFKIHRGFGMVFID